MEVASPSESTSQDSSPAQGGGNPKGTKQARSRHHRQQIVRTAVRLFRRKGYASTGLQEILQGAGAPKGSLYYYFPGGKEELGAEAVRSACAVVERTLTGLEQDSATPEDFIRSYFQMLEGWMQASGFRDGCPVATTLLETTPDVEAIAQAGQEGLESWVKVLARVLEGAGDNDAYRARRQARTVVAAIEGALLLSRAERSAAPLQDVQHELLEMIRSSAERAGRS